LIERELIVGIKTYTKHAPTIGIEELKKEFQGEQVNPADRT
jgi:hypothetical protein